MSLANELVEAVSAWPEVEAITLGGSRATGDNDEKSDYDVYVYVTAPVSAERRRRLLRNYCSHMEIDNDFLGDRRRLHAERRHQYRRAVPRSGPVRSQCRRRGGTVSGQQRLYDVHVAQHAHQQGAVRPRRPVRRDPTAVRRAVPRGTAPQHHQSQHASTYRQPAVVRRTDPQGREPRRQKSRSTIAWPRSWNRISMCYSR